MQNDNSKYNLKDMVVSNTDLSFIVFHICHLFLCFVFVFDIFGGFRLVDMSDTFLRENNRSSKPGGLLLIVW